MSPSPDRAFAHGCTSKFGTEGVLLPMRKHLRESTSCFLGGPSFAHRSIAVKSRYATCSNRLYCSCCTTYVCIHSHPLGEENTATTPGACPEKAISRPAFGYRSAQARHLCSSTCVHPSSSVVGFGVFSDPSSVPSAQYPYKSKLQC